MTLIKSISGIRGTIGSKAGEGLDPLQVVKFTLAYGTYLNNKKKEGPVSIVLGRDARISGQMLEKLVFSALNSIGVNVINGGLSTTPTIELAVMNHKADGGIILTASHNPKNWNALKFFNEEGEFIDAEIGAQVLKMAEEENFTFVEEDQLGKVIEDNTFISKHVEMVMDMPLVDKVAIKKAGLVIIVDAINSTGALAIPPLLDALGVKKYKVINDDVSGNFAHNPEPLPENLSELSAVVSERDAHLGITVDPDVDRLAFVDEDGEMFGEEYTLVAIADYVLANNKGNTVSNLSSTMALRDITLKAGAQYHASAVGEVNVVKKMKEVNAVIGGEGNGGVIYPPLHYGRDALAGIALFLSLLAKDKRPLSILKTTYPSYQISKNKLELPHGTDVDAVIEKIRLQYEKQDNKMDMQDGLKIDFGTEWVHLRKSNTEPIIRIYAESDSMVKSETIAKKIMGDIKEILR